MKPIDVRSGNNMDIRFIDKFAPADRAMISVNLGFVAIRSGDGEHWNWGAYMGDGEATPTEVAAHGLKLNRRMASEIFPNLDMSRYRD